jgi:hypothetical protein
MTQAPQTLQGRRPTKEEEELVALFQTLEREQLELLDQANKRITELTTALLGVLFAAVAFGKDFPPPYLQEPLARWLAVGTLAVYLLAMGCAFLGLRPRDYKLYRHNLTGMRDELDKITKYKSRWFQYASAAFVSGSVLLALLIGSIIL